MNSHKSASNDQFDYTKKVNMNNVIRIEKLIVIQCENSLMIL
jgi:hypothetical protein